MNAGRFRAALLNRELTVGSWIQINNPTSAEVLGGVGFDWIGIDMEHTDIEIDGLMGIMRGMYGRGATPIVRVPDNDVIQIRRALDAGAGGVLVPLVGTAKEAEAAVAAAKFPPKGVRGFAFCRGNDWGAGFDDYAARANDDIAVIVMIESKEGVENIDSILAVDGVDGIFVGPYDMSGSYGIPGQTSHETVRSACLKLTEACARRGKSAGLHVVLPDAGSVKQAIDDGFTLICLGVDAVFLREGAATALRAARSNNAAGNRPEQ